MAVQFSTVLWTEKCGALLQYPTTLAVKFVEKRHGLPSDDSRKKKKKKKKRGPLNLGEKCQLEYHLQVRERLLSCYTRLLEAANALRYFPVHQPHSLVVTESDIDLGAMCSLDSSTHDLDSLAETSSDSHGPTHAFGRVVSNDNDQDRTVSIRGRSFLVPPKSSFLLSDLSKINPLYDHASTTGLYGLIVIDPPWENRSTIRGKKYNWFPSERLLEVSIPRLATVGAIVAVWVTNKRKIATFVQQTLFPKWHVNFLSEWHWLKVTTSGVLVHDMDSLHKKPYEMVIIGKYVGAVTSQCKSQGGDNDTIFDAPCSKRLKTSEPSTSHTISAATSEDESYPLLTHPYILLCVASATHSQKPYLGDILAKHIPKGSQQLELFARNLHPNWTSWGNEVLKFQQFKDLPLSNENIITDEYPSKCQSSC